MAIKGTIPKTKREQAKTFGGVSKLSKVALVTTPNATDEASAVTLANALKTKVNEMLTAAKG